MTLVQLKAVCAAYHRKTVDELTQNGVDLFLVAANNARRNAELRHNFEYSRVLATLDIAIASGGSLRDAVVTADSGYGTFTGIREIVAVSSETAQGYLMPVEFTRADMALERERTMLEQDTEYYSDRYPSDADLLRRGGYGGVIQRGSSLFIYPAPVDSTTDVSVTLQGYGWLADYVAQDLSPTGLTVTGTLDNDVTGLYVPAGLDGNGNQVYFRAAVLPSTIWANTDHWTLTTISSLPSVWDGPSTTGSPVGAYDPSGSTLGTATGTATVTSNTATSDFFLLYGASYLQWEIIIELNYFFKTFVPRQEGNLASPEKQRDAAWQAFLEWDSYLVDSNISRYRG